MQCQLHKRIGRCTHRLDLASLLFFWVDNLVCTLLLRLAPFFAATSSGVDLQNLSIGLLALPVLPEWTTTIELPPSSSLDASPSEWSKLTSSLALLRSLVLFSLIIFFFASYSIISAFTSAGTFSHFLTLHFGMWARWSLSLVMPPLHTLSQKLHLSSCFFATSGKVQYFQPGSLVETIARAFWSVGGRGSAWGNNDYTYATKLKIHICKFQQCTNRDNMQQSTYSRGRGITN